jgi:tRNA A-37 threonylcarbamoyl transferase component Bud32
MKLSLAGVQWSSLSAEGAAWLGALPSPLVEAELIKSSTRRCVWRLPQGLFVKDVRYPGRLRSLLKTLSGGNAGREGAILGELGRRGVAVPEVVACGKVSRGGLLLRDLLVTREVPGCRRLLDYFQDEYGKLPFRAQEEFAKAFAAFIQHLHANGVAHRDLHLGNFLLQRSSGNTRLVLLDADRVKLTRGSLCRAARTENLAVLLCNFWSLGSTAAIFRFLRHYGLSWRTAAERELLASIKGRSLRLAGASWDAHARLCLSTNQRFVARRHGRFRIYHVRRPEVEQTLALLLPDPDRVLEQGMILNAGHFVTAAKVELGGRRFLLKRYHCKGWWARISNAVRRSPAGRIWLTTWKLLLRSIPVPEPLICLEQTRWRLPERSYLLSEYVANADPLTTLWPTPDRAHAVDGLGNALDSGVPLLSGESARVDAVDLKSPLPQGEGQGEGKTTPDAPSPQPSPGGRGSWAPPDPTASGESRGAGGAAAQSTKETPGAPCEPLDESARNTLLARFAIILGRMHRYGAVHGDLKWTKLLVQTGPGRHDIALTDLDDSRFVRFAMNRRAKDDLRRFLGDLQARDGCGKYREFFLHTWRKWSSRRL